MRPTGVVLIAIYHFLTAAVLVFIAVALVVGGSLLGNFLSTHFDARFGAGLGLAVGIVAAVFLFAMAVLAITAGYGMWAMREWGRILNIALAAISLVFALPSLMFSMAHAHIFFGGFLFGGFGLIRIAISALIIWYLIQPSVVALFQRRTPTAYPGR
jgi:hypothetical protein